MTPRPQPRASTATVDNSGALIRSRQRRWLALGLIVAIVLTASGALIFGPARGARNDLAHVRTDLHASRSGIFQTVRVLTGQLETTQQLLLVQQRGLSVARETQRIARTASQHTDDLLNQTTMMVLTIRQVLAALRPLRHLQVAIRLARSTLAVARQTLSTGRAALQTALASLRTLRQSRDIQAHLLQVARQTLRVTREIDRKLPTPPIFPAASGGRP
jgi:hypothetical protein